MEHLAFFGIVFGGSLVIYFLFINRRRLKKGNIKNMGEISYVTLKYRLDSKKINLKYILNITAICNAFIIAFVCVVLAAIPLGIMWQLLIGFVLMIALVYAIYEILGRHFEKKGWCSDAKLSKTGKRQNSRNNKK